jgi:anti-anti-sigma factor
MNIEITHTHEGTTHRLHLRGDMTIYTAAALKPALLDALTACRQLDLNLGDVSELDTAGTQLLLLAKREAEKAGKAVRLTRVSPAVRETVAFYEISADLGMTDEA